MKTTVTEQAVEKIREQIQSGVYTPGKKLPTETALSEMLGVGRSTVREAVRTLQAMGFVEIKPGRGAFVAADDLRDRTEHWFTVNEHTLHDLRSLRWMVEPASAALAATHHTDADTQELHALMTEFATVSQQYAETGDRGITPTLTALDAQFHTMLLRISGNILLTQLYSQIAPLFRQYSIRSFAINPATATAAIEEHQRIAHAVITGDPDAAKAAMEAHLTNASTQMDAYAHGGEKESIE